MSPASAPEFPDFDPDSDPELQAALAEFNQAAQSMQTEYDSQTQTAEVAEEPLLAPAELQRAVEPPDEASIRAEFDKMEAVSFGHSEEAFHGAELTHQVGHTVENLAEQIFEHGHHAAATKELQWFYARGTERVGPIMQSQLLQLFNRGDLEWNTLVWNKKMSDWAKASDTELVDLSEGPPPPPLPPPLPTEKKKKGGRKK